MEGVVYLDMYLRDINYKLLFEQFIIISEITFEFCPNAKEKETTVQFIILTF